MIRLSQRSAIKGPSAPVGQFFANCIEQSSNMQFALGGPVTDRRMFVANRAHPTRFYDESIGNGATFGDGHYNGYKAEVYVFKSGRYALWGEGTVTATKTNGIIEDAIAGGDNIVTTTTYDDAANAANRDGGTIWYSVRAVEAGGGMSPRSAWVPWTLPNPASNGTGSGSTANEPELTDGGSLDAPVNLTVVDAPAANTARLTWDAVPGAIGYTVSISYQDPTLNAEPGEDYIQLSGVGPIPLGAWVILSRKILTPPQTLTAQNFGNAGFIYYKGPTNNFKAELAAQGLASEFVAYTGSDPAPAGIEQEHFARCQEGNYIDLAFHGGAGDTFWQQLEPGRTYRARFLLRAPASKTVTLSVQGVDAGSSDSYAVTTDWQWFETDISRNTILSGSGAYFLRLSGTGSLDIAAFEFYDTAVAKDDLRPIDKLRVSTGTYLRDHRLIKPGYRTVTMQEELGPMGQSYGRQRFSTVHAHLRQCQINGLKPWLQIEWYYTADEWRDFVAYMAAPVSSGHSMALKRERQGQAAPWTDVFPDMIVEFSNEAWQPPGGFWGMPQNVEIIDQDTGEIYTRGDAFGMIYDRITREMQKSPHWSTFRGATLLYLGGWRRNVFGGEAGARAIDCDAIGPVGYTSVGAWDTGGSLAAENGFSFAELLNTAVDHQQDSINAIAEAQSAGKECFVYEDGPSGFITGISVSDAIAQEVVIRSRACATADIDELANRMRLGVSVSAYFNIGAGSIWNSHATAGHGGGYYMSHALRKMIYDHTGPANVTLLSTVQSPLNSRGNPALGAYMFTSIADPSNRVVIATNRNIDPSLLDPTDPDYSATPSGTEAVTVQTGLTACTGVEYFANTGNFREHNRYPLGQRINTSGGFDPDPLCVAFDYTLQTGAVPVDPANIVIDDAYGATANGLLAGNCVLLKLSGCVT